MTDSSDDGAWRVATLARLLLDAIQREQADDPPDPGAPNEHVLF